MGTTFENEVVPSLVLVEPSRFYGHESASSNRQRAVIASAVRPTRQRDEGTGRRSLPPAIENAIGDTAQTMA
jgi:hypothetical protein